jgi:surface antigen
MLKKIGLAILLLVSLFIVIYFLFLQQRYPLHVVTHSFKIGDSIDSHHGIVVYNNGGMYSKSHGKHYKKDSSYYYGKKWQCVEYVKRYYYDYLNHKMPNGYGHAKDFFDKKLEQGELNKERNLLQFYNENLDAPKENDLLIFDGEFGHVAIITKVKSNEIEIIQQNIYMTPREHYKLTFENGNYTIGEKRKPLGWLRLR